jgi:two-component system, NtrC family, sensor kinase
MNGPSAEAFVALRQELDQARADRAAAQAEAGQALARETATADILRVISESPTDVQPVFDAIVAAAVRLIGGAAGHIARLEGDSLHLVAFSKTDAAGDEALSRLYPRPRRSA